MSAMYFEVRGRTKRWVVALQDLQLQVVAEALRPLRKRVSWACGGMAEGMVMSEQELKDELTALYRHHARVEAEIRRLEGELSARRSETGETSIPPRRPLRRPIAP